MKIRSLTAWLCSLVLMLSLCVMPSYADENTEMEEVPVQTETEQDFTDATVELASAAPTVTSVCDADSPTENILYYNAIGNIGLQAKFARAAYHRYGAKIKFPSVIGATSSLKMFGYNPSDWNMSKGTPLIQFSGSAVYVSNTAASSGYSTVLNSDGSPFTVQGDTWYEIEIYGTLLDGKFKLKIYDECGNILTSADISRTAVTDASAKIPFWVMGGQGYDATLMIKDLYAYGWSDCYDGTVFGGTSQPAQIPLLSELDDGTDYQDALQSGYYYGTADCATVKATEYCWLEEGVAETVAPNELTFSFSTAIDPVTWSKDNIILTENGEAFTDFTVRFDEAENKGYVDFGTLNHNKAYTLSLTENITGISGAAMETKTYQFRTPASALRMILSPSAPSAATGDSVSGTAYLRNLDTVDANYTAVLTMVKDNAALALKAISGTVKGGETAVVTAPAIIAEAGSAIHMLVWDNYQNINLLDSATLLQIPNAATN